MSGVGSSYREEVCNLNEKKSYSLICYVQFNCVAWCILRIGGVVPLTMGALA